MYNPYGSNKATGNSWYNTSTGISGITTVASLLGYTNPLGLAIGAGVQGITSLLGKFYSGKAAKNQIDNRIDSLKKDNRIAHLSAIAEKNKALQLGKDAYRSGNFQAGRTQQARVNSQLSQFESQADVATKESINKLDTMKKDIGITPSDIGSVLAKVGSTYALGKLSNSLKTKVAGLDKVETPKLVNSSLPNQEHVSAIRNNIFGQQQPKYFSATLFDNAESYYDYWGD